MKRTRKLTLKLRNWHEVVYSIIERVNIIFIFSFSFRIQFRLISFKFTFKNKINKYGKHLIPFVAGGFYLFIIFLKNIFYSLKNIPKQFLINRSDLMILKMGIIFWDLRDFKSSEVHNSNKLWYLLNVSIRYDFFDW